MDFYEKFHFIFEDDSFYSSPAMRECCTNYRNHVRARGVIRGDTDPPIIANAISRGFSAAFFHIILREHIDRLVKDAVTNSGGEWQG